MEEIYLPVLSHFENGNVWTASGGMLRYRLTPGEETIVAQVWEGPWSVEDSTIEAEQSFPLTEEGLGALIPWLGEWTERMRGRPQKTLDETLALRDAHRAEAKVRAAAQTEG